MKTLRSPLARARRDGFTLVELMVVIAIIALLMTLLMPTLAGVRRTAAMTACQNNVRQIGMAWLRFSIDNRGRSVGRAKAPRTWMAPITWPEILNGMVYNDPKNKLPWMSRPIQRFVVYDDIMSKIGLDQNALGCPDIARVNRGATGHRPFNGNANVLGGMQWGADWAPDEGRFGTYGVQAPNPGFPPNQWYALGALMSRIPRPDVYLMWESCRGNIDRPYRSGEDPSLATPQDPHSKGIDGGLFAFRHPGLTGHFLTADGGVSRLKHDDPTVNVAWRFNLQ